MNSQLLTYGRVLLPLLLHIFFFQHATFAGGWWFLGFHLLGLLLIPLQASPLFLLLVGASFGAIVDVATLEGGLFMSSAVWMALAIPAVNRLLAPREGYEITDQPTIASMGIRWFTVRTLLLLFTHHVWLFTLEAGRWDLLGQAFGKVMASTLLSTTAFLLVLMLTQSQRRKR